MTPEIYVKASELVGRIRDLDTAAWALILAEAEAADPGIGRVAEQILSDIGKAGEFLTGSVPHFGLALLAADPFGLIGETLDNTYVVERLIGHGGVGAVYKARHCNLPRSFAIKVIPRSVSGKVSIEGAAGSLIGHPAVVAITDYKMLPSHDVYLAMDYVDGESLRETMKRQGRVGLSEALDIVSQVAAALDAAHDKGFVHRDIKPENILIASEGADSHRVRVIDFGIAGYESAKRDLEDPELTGIGIGTPGYMSPEQWLGDSRPFERISARTDVYSLAVVFFEMIAGERPILGRPTVVQADVLAAKHRRLSEFAPELPGYISDAVARALSVDPADRPASAGEFVGMLRGNSVADERRQSHAIEVPASLTPIDRIDIETARGQASVEFYHGDLMAMPRDWNVDFLVVSAFRNDYKPTPGSLIGSLYKRGVDVSWLARNKKLDLRDLSSCWLSRKLKPYGSAIPVKRIIGFEPKGMYMPADKIDDFFRFLLLVAEKREQAATVAMPLLGTGGKLGQVWNLVPPLMKGAEHWLKAGLNVSRLIVVEQNTKKVAELRSEIREVKQAVSRYGSLHNQEMDARAREAARRREVEARLQYEHGLHVARWTERLAGAVRRGDLSAVKALLAKGADVTKALPNGGSLVGLAKEYGRTTIAEYLRSVGVD